MKRRWRWNEQSRLVLTLDLAVVTPAAALIVISVMHLKSIQRDRAVEAAIQQDFYQVLAISEKHLNAKTYDMVDLARHEFPRPEEACEESLEKFIDQHVYAASVFVYTPERGVIFAARQASMRDPDFHSEAEDFEKMAPDWMKVEYHEFVKTFREMESKGKLPAYFTHDAVKRGDKHEYQSVAVFLLPETPGTDPALGGLVIDADYLSGQFFPEMLSSFISQNYAEAQRDKSHYGRAVMMMHLRGEPDPIAKSADWDGGEPEMERTLEGGFQGAFPGLVLAIKLQGTTLASLGKRFVRTSFLILGGISLLLAGGIWLTYHNVSKEIALAKLKSDFVSNVSHELRTPLSLIRLYAETLEMGRLTSPEKYQEYYCIIRKESERLTALINNVLDFSRIEAGRKEYEFRATDLGELARNTLESYRYQIEQQGFEFREDIADDLPALWLDREAISRSLLNLVNNALKYSKKEKYLGVKLYRSNGSVKLEVIDHGIGIPRSEQQRIFEKFYRVGDPLVHNTKGSGLGLSLVHHIVEAHGGQISVESTPGQGSKFVIALPVRSGSDVHRPNG